MDEIRNIMNAYDTPGLGVEVFVSNTEGSRHWHVRMRSPAADALMPRHSSRSASGKYLP